MTKLQRLDDVRWFAKMELSAEIGQFHAAFMGVTHVPYNNRWAPFYRSWEYWAVLRHLEFESSDIVIDVGSSRSYVIVYIGSLGVQTVVGLDNRAWELITHDPILYSFEEWAEEVQKYGYTNVHTREGDACSLPYADDTFDVVLSFSVLEHVEDDTRASREAFRVLKPSGVFAGTVYCGRPEESKSNNRLYDMESFHNRLVEPVGWTYIQQAPTKEVPTGTASAMVFLLTKEVTE